jgi:hypothetical protein
MIVLLIHPCFCFQLYSTRFILISYRNTVSGKRNARLSLYQTMEVLRIVRRRGSYIFLDKRLTDGSEVVSLKQQLPFPSRKVPTTHFSYRLRRPQGPDLTERIRSVGKAVTSLRIEPGNFRLVGQCLHQPLY